MKDIQMCQHSISEDITYKEVVVIGNGPSGMVTSYMLAGNVPYLKEAPLDLPIDEMFRARLSNIPPDESLYDVDLMELAGGLEGRSQNPIPLLMDNLLRPCADLGVYSDSLVEWKYEADKQIDHIVLGRGAPGGAWQTFPPAVRTLSPAAWLTLPPHVNPTTITDTGTKRVSARSVATYCRRYVRQFKLQKYFRSGVVVTSVTRLCHSQDCPLKARFFITGYEVGTGVALRYASLALVVASGGGDRASPASPAPPAPALRHLHHLDSALRRLSLSHEPSKPAILVVGSGVSAADAVVLSRAAGLHVFHSHRSPAQTLARLTPNMYPDYCQVYQMMCDGPSGDYPNYTSLPNHTILEVVQDNHKTYNPPTLAHDSDLDDDAIALKRVKLLNQLTNEVKEVTVYIVAVLIGSKPDLHFLQSDFNFNYTPVKDDRIECTKCKENRHPNKRKIEDEPRCFLRSHWLLLKCVIGQGIRSCKTRYLNYTEINGNTDEKCPLPDCKSPDRLNNKYVIVDKLENGSYDNRDLKANKLEINLHRCKCDANPYSDGIGFGIDEKRPVDCRSNPLAIDKSSHEMLNAPKGMYALGPVTADNFMRFIPGGALAIVSSLHRQRKVVD